MERRRRGRPRHPDVLTPAEWRVLEALREGGTNAEIGERLGITADGVKFHISNMLSKLGVRNRRELAAWRPDTHRDRLGGLYGVPAGIAAMAKPVAWAGVGAAALAGVVVTAVAAVAVVAVVLVPAGGDGEALLAVKHTTSPTASTPTPIPTPRAAPKRDGTEMRYTLLDTTGAVAEAGSYAFLQTAADSTSAIDNFGRSPVLAVELLIHPVDAYGVSRNAFFGTIREGDVFDYRVIGGCTFRFRVTRVGAGMVANTFGTEFVAEYGGACLGFVDEPTRPRAVEFRWGVAPGYTNYDGRRVLLVGEPTGEGTYQVAPRVWCMIDVPRGMRVAYFGMPHNDPDEDGRAPQSAAIEDLETGSKLHIDPRTCGAYSPYHHRFRSIVESLRRAY